MSLVDKDHMTDLFPASSSKSTAESAEDDIQLKAVAYAINSAANTGQFRVIFQEPLRDRTVDELESKGYSLKFLSYAREDQHVLISWGDESAKASKKE